MRLLIAFCFYFGAVLGSLSAQDLDTQIQKARFLIEKHIAQTNIPGVQVAVMMDGKLVWSETWGYSNLEKSQPLEASTPMRVASVSKAMTSVALGKLIEEERIDIDADIRNYLTAFPDKGYKITTRQLASSTSGIRHYTSKDPVFNQHYYPSVSDALSLFKDDPLLFEPGTDFYYSSYGWVLLSAVMEEAANTPFDRLMENTWSELTMRNTYLDHAKYHPPNISTSYIKKDKDFLSKIFSNKGTERIQAPYEDRSFMYAGGGYLSTAEDLVKMGTNLLQNRFLNQATTDILFSSQKLKNGRKTYYGLGWETGLSRLSTAIVFHSGSMSTARSHLIIYPEKEVVFAYIANTGDHIFFNDREAQNIAELFVKVAEPKAKRSFNQQHLIGDWEIETTSLRNKKTTGRLKLKKNDKGIITGEITFARSKRKKSFPIVLTDINGNEAHLVGVSPMFMDFFITLHGNSFEGEWLHDFNVKGISEEDSYWNPRAFFGKKLKPTKSE